MDPFLPKFVANQETAVVPFFYKHEGEDVVKIQIAGNTSFAPVFRVNDLWVRDGLEEITYADRWPQEYENYKNGFAQVANGTALEEATFLNPSRIAELRQLKVYSVEALANLDDRNIPRLGGKGYELKHMAQEWLQKRMELGANNKVSEMAKEIERLRALVEGQNAPVADEGEYTALKEAIKAKSGSYPRGNPTLQTLQRIVAELNEQTAA